MLVNTLQIIKTEYDLIGKIRWKFVLQLDFFLTNIS